MMGSGKSSVGRLVAVDLGWDHIDTDAELERRAASTIARLFEDVGEPTFRLFEAKVVGDLAADPEPKVVSTGGGVVLADESVAAMRASGTVVWLTADAGDLAGRVGAGEGRPLLGDDPASDLARLTAEREPAYRAAAHHEVATDGRPPEDIASLVVELCRPD